MQVTVPETFMVKQDQNQHHLPVQDCQTVPFLRYPLQDQREYKNNCGTKEVFVKTPFVPDENGSQIVFMNRTYDVQSQCSRMGTEIPGLEKEQDKACQCHDDPEIRDRSHPRGRCCHKGRDGDGKVQRDQAAASVPPCDQQRDRHGRNADRDRHHAFLPGSTDHHPYNDQGIGAAVQFSGTALQRKHTCCRSKDKGNGEHPRRHEPLPGFTAIGKQKGNEDRQPRDKVPEQHHPKLFRSVLLSRILRLFSSEKTDAFHHGQEQHHRQKIRCFKGIMPEQRPFRALKLQKDGKSRVGDHVDPAADLPVPPHRQQGCRKVDKEGQESGDQARRLLSRHDQRSIAPQKEHQPQHQGITVAAQPHRKSGDDQSHCKDRGPGQCLQGIVIDKRCCVETGQAQR